MRRHYYLLDSDEDRGTGKLNHCPKGWSQDSNPEVPIQDPSPGTALRTTLVPVPGLMFIVSSITYCSYFFTHISASTELLSRGDAI